MITYSDTCRCDGCIETSYRKLYELFERTPKLTPAVIGAPSPLNGFGTISRYAPESEKGPK